MKNYSLRIDQCKSNIVKSIVTHALKYKFQISYLYTNGAQEIKGQPNSNKTKVYLLLKVQTMQQYWLTFLISTGVLVQILRNNSKNFFKKPTAQK